MLKDSDRVLYYKVVSEGEDNKLYSSIIHKIVSNSFYFNTPMRDYKVVDLLVEYKVGKWVKPIIKGTKLCVFSTLEAAVNFAVRQFIVKPKVYTCHIKGKGVLVANIAGQYIDSSFVESIVDKWKDWEKNKRKLCLYHDGISATQVKLLESINIDDSWRECYHV